MSPQSMTRRRFLASTAAAATLALGTDVRSAEPPAKIGFGFSLYGMKSIKLSQALKICADIGYSGVELACLKDWPCDPLLLQPSDRKDLRTELNDLALDLPCLMDNLGLLVADEVHRTNLERLKLVSQLGHDLFPDSPPIIETVLGGKPDDWMSVKDRMVEKLKDWEKVAAAQKTVIAIKAHAFGALHTSQDAVWLADQINSPWIRLVFDYSHFQRQGLPLQETLAKMISKTVFVHVKDNVTANGKTEFALPGDTGDTDYVQYLKQLRDGGYRGAVVVEVSAQVSGKPGYDPIAAAKKCYRNLQPAFVKAGLRVEP